MNEQVLKDLVATAQANEYSWDTITPKFPELANFDEQVLKDYVATAEQDGYDYTKVNAKFPEFKIQETIVEDISKPTDPLKKEPASLSESVDIFNQRKKDLIKNIENREADGTLVISPIELPEKPLITDEVVKDFNVKFGDVITEAKKQRKKEITTTLQGFNIEGDSVATPINFSEDMYDLQRLYDIGFEQRLESKNDQRIQKLENQPELSTEDQYFLNLYKDRQRKENNDYLQSAILNENGKTPKASEIFNIYNELEIDNANAKAETTVLDEVKQEGTNEEDETFYSKVNDKINKDLVSRAVVTMNDIYGEEAVAKVRNAKTAEQQRKALRELRNDAQVNIYYDPQTGEIVNKDLLDEEEINRQDNLFLETADKFMFMPINEQVKALKQLENKVAAMGNSLFQSQQQGNPTLLQSLGANWNDEKSTKQDAVDIETMANTGIVPPSISTLPNGGNVFKEPNAVVKKYNDLVETLKVQRSVVGINLDPTTLSREKTTLGFIPFTDADEKLLGSAVAAIPDAFNLESLSTNEMANRFVYDVLSDELGKFKNIDREEAVKDAEGNIIFDKRSEKAQALVDRVGDRGDYYVGAMENIGSTITPLVKMSGEIMLWTALTGGTGTVGRASLAIGEIAAVNFARLGLNSNAALRVGQFTSGVLQESWGLAGSNLIGGTIANTDPMPVLPFAIGSQVGHLGFNWMSKTLPKAILKVGEKNKYVATAVNIFDKYTPRTLLGAAKFASKPLISTSAIKGGELSSGIVDVAEGKMEFDEVWNQVTDSESFWDMYGSLLSMGMARPGSYGKKIIQNFHYDIDNIRTNQPKFNQLARQLGAEVKKTGSWSEKEVDDAKLKKLDEINKNDKLTETEKADQRANVEFIANRLKLKEALDQVDIEMKGLENWNGLNKRLEATIRSLDAGNGLTAEGITNIAEAGLANGGGSPILELQKIGLTEKQATDIYKVSEISYAEAQQIFPDVTSNGYKRYVENTLKQDDVRSNIESLDKQFKDNKITEGYYKTAKENLKAEQEKLVQESQDLMKEAEQARSGRVEQTMRQAEEVLKDPEAQVRELSDAKFTELKRELGSEVESVGFGFQTTIDGKTVFAINKDKMKEYRKGSTLKHEIYHPVFERSFSIEGIRKRAKELVNERNIDFADAKELAEKEALDYIDSFTNRLKDIGIFEKVEAEMLDRPGYKELKESGNRNINIEKEFINEFLELENEGALTGLTRDIKIKKIAPDALNSRSGADVVDYFLGGVERTPEAKEALKKAQQEYIELVKDGKGSIQTSEKDLQSLAKEYKENPNTIEVEKIGELIQQYTASGIDALKRIANTGKRKVPVNTKDPKIRNGIADLLVLEFDSFIRNYDPTKGKPSTYMNLIAERILPKYVEKFKPTETTRIDDLTREIADTKTPETDLIDKESATRETERLVSVFEGKEAKAKEKEIIEVFEDLRSNPEKLEEARVKGFGGTPKEQLGKVAELLFNIPDGTKVSNPSKNVLPTINIVDSKGKKISKKKLDAGEKGIIEAKDFLSLRDYFKDKNNLRRFLNVSLPEYNVNTPRSIVNAKGEIIEVSPDVVGRGIRLPDRIYDYFYERFIDPTGEMTSPSGRSKGKTSQVPKVYKIKPEFRKPSNEVVEKVSKDILADLKLSELPETYTRNIAQLVKGMALVETMAVSNQAKRTKLPAETAAEKQLIADIKSSSSKLSMSEKKIAKVVSKEGYKSIPEILGEKSTTDYIVDKAKGDFLDVGGNFFVDLAKKSKNKIRMFGSGIFSSRADFLKAVKDKFPLVGDYQTGVKNYTKTFLKRKLSTVKNPSQKTIDKLTKEAEIEAIETMKPTLEAIEAGMTMQTSDLQKQMLDVVESNPSKYKKYSREQLAKMEKAIAGQRTNTLKKNIENMLDIKEGKDLVLDIFRDLLELNPDNMPLISYMLWHPKSNSHVLRNFATMRGKELGQDFNYEEHGLPFGEFSLAIINGLRAPKKVWNELKDFMHEQYYQVSISKESKNILDHPKRNLDKEGNIIEDWSSATELHPLSKKQMDQAAKGEISYKDVIDPFDMRKYNEYKSDRGYINPNKQMTLDKNGKLISDAKKYDLEVSDFLSENPAVIEAQNKLIYELNLTKAGILKGEKAVTIKDAKKTLDYIIKAKATKEADAAFKETKTEIDGSGVMNTSEKMTTEELVEKAKTIDKALQMADRPNMPKKKIRIFDFDDTVAKTNSKVFAEKEGERIELTAEEFAEKGIELIDQGYEMDFTDFNKVVEGKKGPLFDLIKKLKESPGERDLFILTARAPESQQAIFEFMKAMGVEIPLENITGLGNSTGEAKANWIIDKAAEGYNDFYFADDAPQNVKAVKTALDVIDVKSKVQQARLNTSEKMNTSFNEILEESTGIDAFKVFSDVKAQVRGGKKKGQRFFIPPSAEDFLGLLYTTLPKGRKGEKALKFYQDALLDPYTRAMTNLSTSRVNIMADFKKLKKELDVPKDLKKETESGFTNEQAVRVYLWNKVGEKIPGLSKTDLKELSNIVEKDPKLKVFADEILSITKGDGYSKPAEGWANGTITTDLVDILNTTKRGKYLETWKENVGVIFSKENLNKLEAAYGKKYREAVENSLARMKTGSNRTGGGNRLSNQVLDYINNSTGVTMFVNARSALLQTISSANFINWSFNNPYKAGKAFANQPQFWKDFKMLINSDYLKDRRNGLKLNISESEIANAAKTSKNKAKAVLSYILEKGYAPTKYADSFAIAFGGASYYRNRVKDLIKNKGMSESEASKQAMIDWRAESEKSQQSSDPSKISAQQASDLGRVVLQYVNTPMQYARLQKRDVQDIVNKRRIPGKTLAESNRIRVSRIIYYAAIQSLVFNAMQQGLFSLGFGDQDVSDNEEKKIVNAANGMLDSSLRGLGVGGVTVQVLKNLGIDIYRRTQKDRPEYVDAWIKLLEFSPAIKSKLSRFKSAAYPFDNKKKREEVFEKGFALNNPAYESAAKVITATTNVPLDRVISKTNNLKRAFDDDVEAWMSVAMILGWPEWQLQDKQDKQKKNQKNKKKEKTDFGTGILLE